MRPTAPSHLGTKRSSRHPNQHSRNLSRRRTFAYSPQRGQARRHARKRIARIFGLITPAGISRQSHFNGEKELWLREVLFAGWSGGDLRETWHDLLAVADELASEAGTAQRLIAAHGAELPEERAVDELATILTQICDYLEGGGSFGLRTKVTKRAWHTLLEQCGVDFRTPQATEKVRALRAKAELEVKRGSLASRWGRLVECHGGPAFETFGASPERTAQGYAQEIRTRLEWRATVWEPLIAELCAAGFRWDAWLAAHPQVAGEHGELTRVERAGSQPLAEVVEAQAALMRQIELSAALSQQRTYLAAFPQSEAATILLQAQDNWDTETYEEVCRQLAGLEWVRDTYQTRLALLARIENAAPAWAHAINQRHGVHGATDPPGDSTAAWRWRQWHDELERRASVSISELQERLQATREELRSLASEIIEHETWASQRERTVLQSQQALMGYVQTIRKVGRGTGKRAPELLRQARQLLTSARRAVPVWIMPLSRVYESFDPRETRFDVVIIDEASQSDVTSLAALYFGREHIVVGDEEQVTPDAVGQRLDHVQRLIDTNLQGIPNSHLYDGQTSIYDLAKTAFGSVVALREHFRCVPEIIQFCNDLSYNLTIRPLREPKSAAVRPALIAHRVHGFREGNRQTNQVEAEEIASLVVACLSDADYALNEFQQPTTFGVISLVGIEQALLIEEMLRRKLSPSTFAKHRLLCGNAAQFQGDERDVVFLSMVNGPPDDGQLPTLEAGPRDLYKKRYNVAVSRARNELWVVHSLDPSTHLRPRDLRRRLIEHARDPQALLRAMEVQGKRTDSIFEKLVLQRLLAPVIGCRRNGLLAHTVLTSSPKAGAADLPSSAMVRNGTLRSNFSTTSTGKPFLNELAMVGNLFAFVEAFSLETPMRLWPPCSSSWISSGLNHSEKTLPHPIQVISSSESGGKLRLCGRNGNESERMRW